MHNQLGKQLNWGTVNWGTVNWGKTVSLPGSPQGQSSFSSKKTDLHPSKNSEFYIFCHHRINFSRNHPFYLTNEIAISYTTMLIDLEVYMNHKLDQWHNF